MYTHDVPTPLNHGSSHAILGVPTTKTQKLARFANLLLLFRYRVVLQQQVDVQRRLTEEKYPQNFENGMGYSILYL